MTSHHDKKTILRVNLCLMTMIFLSCPFSASSQQNTRPNIVFILMDNLGYGEVGCYGGGITRGAPTPRIDKLATQGMRLTNFNVEAQCTPSRSAILTGRFAIRSGTHSVPIAGGLPDGLTQWEITMAELLSSQGYATAHFGKWHLGSNEGRLPNNQGFDEWYGIPRTTDESYWPSKPGFDKSGAEPEYIMEGKKGEKSKKVKVYDLEQRRLIDEEVTDRTVEFMKRNHTNGKPFYVYVPFTLVHFPTLANPKFKDKTGYGEFPDCLVEMDAHVGRIIDAIDEMGISNNTIFIFTSDNGPDPNVGSNGWSGPWTGYYFTHMEGSLRTPFIIRYPGKIPEGTVSNEIVHEVDLYTTLAKLTGAKIPTDRMIDGIDQTDFFFGRVDTSAREGFPVFVSDRLEAVKWRNWKIAFYESQRDWYSPLLKLGTPKIYNLITDPKEEYAEVGIQNGWVAEPSLHIVGKYMESLKKYPNIAPGEPDPYVPSDAKATNGKKAGK